MHTCRKFVTILSRFVLLITRRSRANKHYHIKIRAGLDFGEAEVPCGASRAATTYKVPSDAKLSFFRHAERESPKRTTAKRSFKRGISFWA